MHSLLRKDLQQDLVAETILQIVLFLAVQNEKTYSITLKTVTATEKYDTQMPEKQELPVFISTLQQEV